MKNGAQRGARRPDGETQAMSLAKQLNNYRLTTAEILYHMPDHPGILQS